MFVKQSLWEFRVDGEARLKRRWMAMRGRWATESVVLWWVVVGEEEIGIEGVVVVGEVEVEG